MSQLWEDTKTAAYLLWEGTQSQNALGLWYCAEDIAYFLETKDVLSIASLENVLALPCYDITYVCFVRNIAFRIFYATGQDDPIANWYQAERLLQNREWKNAVISMAQAFHEAKKTKSYLPVRSLWIRRQLK